MLLLYNCRYSKSVFCGRLYMSVAQQMASQWDLTVHSEPVISYLGKHAARVAELADVTSCAVHALAAYCDISGDTDLELLTITLKEFVYGRMWILCVSMSPSSQNSSRGPRPQTRCRPWNSFCIWFPCPVRCVVTGIPTSHEAPSLRTSINDVFV